jgi:hypothetical protein
MNKLRFFFTTSLLLLFVGCERGCTTQSTLDAESKTITLHGESINVEVRLVDYRNSKAINHNVFRRSVTHTYGISIDVYYRGQRLNDIFTEAVDNPDQVDLDKELKRVLIALSKDGNHLGVGVDNKVSGLFHFYKEHPIHSMSMMALDPQIGTPWSKLKIDAFPSPRELILEGLREDCHYFTGDEELLQAFMNDVKPYDTAHRVLLAAWPRCNLALDYYNEATVKKLRADKTWRNWAEARCVAVLRADYISADRVEAHAFFQVLNSYEVRAVQDSVLVEGWGSTTHGGFNDVLIERVGQRNFPVDKRKMVYAKAREGLKFYMQKGYSNYQREARYCLRVLDAMGDTTQADLVLHYALERVGKIDDFDMIEVAFECYDIYTPTQQKYIRAKADFVMEKIKDYSRSQLFKKTVGIVDCRRFKDWKKKYPGDLAYEELPEGC